jgi:hypothetical protein
LKQVKFKSTRYIRGACCAVLAALLAACSSSIIEKGGWEGIRDHTLRVYVSLDIPEDMNSSAAPGQMSVPLVEAGKKRAGALLSGYIRETIADPDRADTCYRLIPGIIAAGVTVYHECGEDACSAFMDFNIRELLETARGSTGR